VGNGDETKKSPNLLHIDFSNDTWWFSTELEGWSFGNMERFRLFDNARFTPPTDQDDLKVKAGITVIDVLWAKKSKFFLSSILDADASYTTQSGVSGVVKLNTSLYYQAMKNIRISFGVTLNGTWDENNGFDGSAQFTNTSVQLTNKKSDYGVVFQGNW
jgi:hypothetical protein